MRGRKEERTSQRLKSDGATNEGVSNEEGTNHRKQVREKEGGENQSEGNE